MIRRKYTAYYRLSVLALLFFTVACDLLSNTVLSDTCRPKVAVVLSGGGAKGFAHIGVLKVLEEEGIPVDIIIGTSMGAIVGGLYSIGYRADDLCRVALSQNWQDLLTDNISRKELDQVSKINRQRYLMTLHMSDGSKPSLQAGLINGQNILNLLCGLTADFHKNTAFNEFPVSFACIGTDFKTGEEVLLDKGFLPVAMFASMAIPGIFLPIECNGHQLVDGGVVNNFPADVAKNMGADIIIGVDISGDPDKDDNINTLNDVVGQLVSFYTLRKNSENRALCDLLICPDITGYSVTSFNREAIDTLINRGIREARTVVDNIREIKSVNKLHKEYLSAEGKTQNEWTIQNITFTGNYSMPESYFKDKLKLNIPDTYSYPVIKQSINNLYGTNNYKRVYFNLDESTSGKNLNIILEEGRSWDINVGMRINSKSATSVVLNSTRRDLTRTIDLISLTADISSNPGVNILLESNINKGPTFSFMLDGLYKNMKIWPDRTASFNTDFFYVSAELISTQKVFRYLSAGSGMKEEYYKGKLSYLKGDTLMSTAEDDFVTKLVGYVSFDNLYDFYFPRKGNELYTELSFTANDPFQGLYPVLLLKNRNYFQLNTSFSLLANIYGRILFSENIPRHFMNLVGGHDYELMLGHQLPFFGLPPFTPTKRLTSIVATGLRLNISDKHYVSLYGNCLLHNDDFSHFGNYRMIWGTGLVYAYKSIIGPVEMMIGYSDEFKKPVISANIGYWF